MEVPKFTILDYGVTALGLLVLGFCVYLFIKFLTNHMSMVTQTLENLVGTTQSQNETMRTMADEFHRMSEESLSINREVRAHDWMVRRFMWEMKAAAAQAKAEGSPVPHAVEEALKNDPLE